MVDITITNGSNSFSYLWHATGYVPGTSAFALRAGGTGYALFDNVSISAVPEASTTSLLAAGLLLVAATVWRRRA